MNAIKNSKNGLENKTSLQMSLMKEFGGRPANEVPLNLKKESLVVFDFDETLVETQHLHTIINEKVLKLLNLPYDDSLPLNIFNRVYKEDLGWGKTLDEQIDFFKNTYSPVVDKFMQQSDFVKATRFFNGMVDVIRLLSKSNIALAIASSRDLESIIKVLKYNGLVENFDIVEATYGGRKFNDKPDTHVVDYISSELGISLENSIMVGDSPCDVIMGKEAGMKTIAIDYGKYNKGKMLEELRPDVLLRSIYQIKELPSLIKGLLASSKIR